MDGCIRLGFPAALKRSLTLHKKDFASQGSRQMLRSVRLVLLGSASFRRRGGPIQQLLRHGGARILDPAKPIHTTARRDWAKCFDADAGVDCNDEDGWTNLVLAEDNSWIDKLVKNNDAATATATSAVQVIHCKSLIHKILDGHFDAKNTTAMRC